MRVAMRMTTISLLLASLVAPGCVTTRLADNRSARAAQGCFELTPVDLDRHLWRGCGQMFRCARPRSGGAGHAFGSIGGVGRGPELLIVVVGWLVLSGLATKPESSVASAAEAAETPPPCEPVTPSLAELGPKASGMVTDANPTNTRWQGR